MGYFITEMYRYFTSGEQNFGICREGYSKKESERREENFVSSHKIIGYTLINVMDPTTIPSIFLSTTDYTFDVQQQQRSFHI